MVTASNGGKPMGNVARSRHEAVVSQLLAIYEISKVLGSSLDTEKSLRGVLNILSAHLRMRRGMVCLRQPSGGFYIAGAPDLTSQEIERGKYRSGEGVIGQIIKSGMPIVVPDIRLEPRFLNRTESRDFSADQVIAFLGVPIQAGNELLGALAVDRETEDALSTTHFERDIRFLKMVANLVGQMIRLHRNIAAEREELLVERSRLQKELRGKYSLDSVIGQSRRMQEVFAEVHQVAPSRATVLLRGESGTGKEVIARAIHYLSPRKDKPFIRVNCAALTESLLESELFGHEKGAFTGATSDRKGRFELADGGTLFLDEIGEVSPAFQSKLLRVLQEREFERVGGNRPIHVDVRIITATNRNLEEAVSNKEFRADLYYRINVVTLALPALRERREDIPLLAAFFLDKFNRENQRNLTFSAEAVRTLLACNWPGNVRELENCIERTATMTRGNLVQNLDLPCQQGKCFSMLLQIPGNQPLPQPSSDEVQWRAPALAEFSDEAADSSERDRLIQAMEQSGWVQAKAARLLNLTPRQIGYALKKHQIPLKHL